MDKNIRKDRKQGLQLSEEVILDGSRSVKILYLMKRIAIVSDGKEKQLVTKDRLVKKIDLLSIIN